MSATAPRIGPADLGLLLLVPALFAANNVAARLADGVIPPAALSLCRWGITALLLAPLVLGGLRGRGAAIRAELPQVLILAALGMVLVSLATYGGATLTSATNIGLIYAATPGLILLFDRLITGVALTGPQMAGFAACLAGMLVIVAQGDPLRLWTLTLSGGDVIVAAGTLAWAAYSVLLRAWPSGFGALERVFLLAVAGSALVLPVWAVEQALFARIVPGAAALGIAATVGVLAGAVLIVAHLRLTMRLGPRRAVVLLYLIPIHNVALAALVIGERPQGFHLLGAGVVMAGIWLSTRAPRPRPEARA